VWGKNLRGVQNNFKSEVECGNKMEMYVVGKGGATNLKVWGSMYWKVAGQYSKTLKFEKG